jgi:hypothetical protein
MALDVYSTPCMSDEPERVFSTTGALLALRRRQLKGEIVEQLICLRAWDRSGIISLSQGLFNSVVANTSLDDDDNELAELNRSNLLHHEQGYSSANGYASASSLSGLSKCPASTPDRFESRIQGDLSVPQPVRTCI